MPRTRNYRDRGVSGEGRRYLGTEAKMQFDMRALDKQDRYRIIGACVTPRPIAWVSSLSSDGIVNVSPFSFFNAIGDDPPTVVLGFAAHPDGRFKDTPSNIRATAEFVIHLVNEAHAEAMNLTAIDAPAEVDEGQLAALEMVPSEVVTPLRIATAPVAFECRMLHWIETGQHQVAIIAEILISHISDEFVADSGQIILDVTAMKLISRLHGAGWYGRQTDKFEMLRPRWVERPMGK